MLHPFFVIIIPYRQCHQALLAYYDTTLNQKSMNDSQKPTINAKASRNLQTSSSKSHLSETQNFRKQPETFHWDLNSLKVVMYGIERSVSRQSVQKKKNLHFNGFLMSCVFCLNSQLGDVPWTFWGPMGVIIKRSIYSFKLTSNIATYTHPRRAKEEFGKNYEFSRMNSRIKNTKHIPREKR